MNDVDADDLDPTLTGGGALRAEKVIDTVATMLGSIRIEDCPIPSPRSPRT